MQEILDHFRANGLDPQDLILDGKVHKFKIERRDHKKSAWYCGFQNYAPSSGAQFYVVVYGNYRTWEKHQYQSDLSEMTTADRELVKKQIAKLKKEAEDAREREHEEVAVDCQQAFEQMQSEGLHCSYLDSRGLNGNLYGAKPALDPNFGPCLFVPLRDVEGKLWNLQKIQSDGGKFFAPGGRVEGCFHTIGELKDETQPIFVVEGFATGITIHLATEGAVFVAFNASNLSGVASELRRRHPGRAIIVCGDEDLWTWIGPPENRTKRNTGREAAEDAAKRVLGVSIFPKFSSPLPPQIEFNADGTKADKGPTDFDDLRQLEGIEKVREQITGVKEPEKHYVVALGYDSGDYFFLSNVNPQIQRLSASQLNSSGLCRLQSLAYWEALYPAKNDGVSWTRAADELMQACHRIGIFRTDKVRGRGVWSDGGKTVYHRGTRLYVDGNDIPLHRNGLHSKYVYDYSEEMPPLHPAPLSVEECQALLDASASVRWKRSESFMLYAGWLAIAPLGGSLNWRPHLWITGVSGSGKSYVIEDMTYPLIQHFCQYFRGQTTEAGIRQKCGSSTLPIIFDEFETDDEHSSTRIKSVLELARQASSSSDGIVAKGTVTGTAMEFRPQFSMCVGSIRVNLIHEQDQNRFTVLELARPESHEGQNEQFDRLKKFVARLGEDYGLRLFSRMVSLAQEVRQSASVFQRVISEKYPMRVGQQYGALLAGYWMLTHDEAVSDEDARKVCDAMNFAVAQEAVERKDEEECLEHLLTKRIKVDLYSGNKEYPMAEAVRLAKIGDTDGARISAALQIVGVKVTPEWCCIAGNSHAELAKLFEGTKWSRNWQNSVLRLPGAKKGQIWIGGRNTKGIFVPWQSVMPDQHAQV